MNAYDDQSLHITVFIVTVICIFIVCHISNCIFYLLYFSFRSNLLIRNYGKREKEREKKRARDF